MKRIIVSLLTILTLTCSVLGGERYFSGQRWSVDLYQDRGFCVAHTSYKEPGIILGLMSDGEQVSLGIQGIMMEDGFYDFPYATSNGKVFYRKAHTVQNIIMVKEVDAESIASFMTSESLIIPYVNKNLRLDGSYEAIKKVIECGKFVKAFNDNEGPKSDI